MRIRRYIDITDIREGDVLCIGSKDIDKQNSHFITVSKIIKNYYDNDVYCIFVYFENGYWHEVNQEYVTYRILSYTENDDYVVDKIEK